MPNFHGKREQRITTWVLITECISVKYNFLDGASLGKYGQQHYQWKYDVHSGRIWARTEAESGHKMPRTGRDARITRVNIDTVLLVIALVLHLCNNTWGRTGYHFMTVRSILHTIVEYRVSRRIHILLHKSFFGRLALAQWYISYRVFRSPIVNPQELFNNLVAANPLMELLSRLPWRIQIPE